MPSPAFFAVTADTEQIVGFCTLQVNAGVSWINARQYVIPDIYCARGQAENLVKLHKGQLASDRTSCQSPLANQFRLVLRTAAYWLMLALRDAAPRRMPLAWAEFATLRARLLKIGARVVERAARIRIHFASACPDAALFGLLAGRLAASGP